MSDLALTDLDPETLRRLAGEFRDQRDEARAAVATLEAQIARLTHERNRLQALYAERCKRGPANLPLFDGPRAEPTTTPSLDLLHIEALGRLHQDREAITDRAKNAATRAAGAAQGKVQP